MRGHCWSARALVLSLGLGLGLAGGLAGCGGPSGFYASQPPRIPLGGDFTVQPGGEVVVYGVRAERCGMPPPTFEAAADEMFAGENAQAPSAGEVYDAGIGRSVAVLCGGTVPVRAIGYRAPADFEGEVAMTFYGTDQATVTVARPPEPADETPPEAEPATATEPAPLADPNVTPPAGEQPAPDSAPFPEDEPGPPPS